jgi:fucose 4-O-acetylase-like acetyltransferase
MEKRQDIELLRILSAFGIIWFHVEPYGRELAYSGLVIFLVIGFYFQPGRSEKQRSPLGRARRLLIPWVAWFLFYGVFNVLRGLPFLETSHGLVAGWLTGTSIHLWYLPFVFLLIVLLDFLEGRFSAQKLGYGCGILAVFALGMAPLWRGPSLQWSAGPR